MPDLPDLRVLRQYRSTPHRTASPAASVVLAGVLVPASTMKRLRRARKTLDEARRRARALVKNARRDAEAAAQAACAAGYAQGYADSVRACADAVAEQTALAHRELHRQLDAGRAALAERLGGDNSCRQLLDEVAEDFAQRLDAIAGTTLVVRLPRRAARLAPAVRARLAGLLAAGGNVVVQTGGAHFALEWAGRALLFEPVRAASQLLPAAALADRPPVDVDTVRRRVLQDIAAALDTRASDTAAQAVAGPAQQAALTRAHPMPDHLSNGEQPRWSAP